MDEDIDDHNDDVRRHDARQPRRDPPLTTRLLKDRSDRINNVMPHLNEVTIDMLEANDAIENLDINGQYLDAQFLHLVTPSPQATASVYRRVNGRTVVQNNNSFSRIFMVRMAPESQIYGGERIAYIMETSTTNNKLFNSNTEHRDNGEISIGSFIRIMCPMPVESTMRGDIPMLTTGFSIHLLEYPRRLPTIQVNPSIASNCSQAFVYNNTQISVLYTEVLKTDCRGKLCDRQRVKDWNNQKRGCGCYANRNLNYTNLAIKHTIRIATADGVRTMSDFSSLKFSSLYLNSHFPSPVKEHQFAMTLAFLDLKARIQDCIGHINDNGGFTVVGWYKKGEIKDSLLYSTSNDNGNTSASNGGNENTVDSSEINYHIVQIIPSDRSFLDNMSPSYTALAALKFDVSQIQA